VKVVCDTNVLVAALAADGLCRDIVKRRFLQVELFTSEELLRELESTVRAIFRTDPADLPLLAAYRERALLVDPTKLARPICRDPDDDVVLATAKAAGADCILTGDKDLQVLKRFDKIEILSPRAFVEVMDRGR
jgi:putative PIN family toxin of toxin-antitoxin system